jgi:pimeloyl-ACP methyl ester carboxylesterase
MTTTTGLLPVPGATLYYEVRGTGPTLLMISPGLGDCGFYGGVADQLADIYQVVTYDRRGNSRSRLDNPDEDLDVAVQTDDALRMLRAVAGGSADVFGGSGGAIVGLDLAARHPELVRTLVAHEPPTVTLLPDAEQRLAVFDEVYDLYRREGVMVAIEAFSQSYQSGAEEPQLDPDHLPAPELLERIHGNFEYFLAHEMRQFVQYQPDQAALVDFVPRGGRLVLGGGVDSRNAYPYQSGKALHDRLDNGASEFREFEGEHGGYLTQPAAFAIGLREVLVGERATA